MLRYNDGNIYFPSTDGHFISENQRRVAEILADYDPNLELQWIPPNERGSEDFAFRVVDRNPGRPPYAVCFAHEADERLLAKVFMGDHRKHNVLEYLDKVNAAQEIMNTKFEMEQREADHELAYSVLRSNKIHYKHNGVDFGKVMGGRYER